MLGNEIFFSLLITCLLVIEFYFDAMLCSNLSYENSDTGHIKYSHGPHFCPLAAGSPPLVLIVRNTNAQRYFPQIQK